MNLIVAVPPRGLTAWQQDRIIGRRNLSRATVMPAIARNTMLMFAAPWLSGVAEAHSGHGTHSTSSPWHYLLEWEHALGLSIALILGITTGIWWLTRRNDAARTSRQRPD